MKPLKIIRAEEAVRDMADIHLFIAVENPDAAERFLAALQLSFRTLAQWPEVGPRYQSNRAGLAGMRFWPVRRFANYLIFYRVTAAPRRLHIIRILHGARDVPQVLD
ncbi:MAG: type II toxin-antitoxin system RelE/ParE family toxin [Verrucomicrobiota bacterium]